MKITLRPRLLEDFADAAEEAVADLRHLLPEVERSLNLYRTQNPDYGMDVSAPLHGTAGLTDHMDALGDEVARLARAARDLDDDLDALGRAQVVEEALHARVEHLVNRWDQPADLRDMIQPLGRDDWNHLVWGPIPPNCGPAATYTGGGAVIGPDGRTYPLVIPEVIGADGEIYRASGPALPPDLQVSSLNGTDTGWSVDHILSGTTRIQDTLNVIQKFAVGTLGLNPTITVPSPASDRTLDTLQVTADGWPSVTRLPKKQVGGSSPSVPEEMAPRRGQAPAVALDLLTGGLQGVALVQDANQQGRAAFQLVFETHPAGRRRAQLRVYSIKVIQGAVTINPSAAALTDEDLDLRPLRFRPPTDLTMGAGPTEPSQPAHVIQIPTELERR